MKTLRRIFVIVAALVALLMMAVMWMAGGVQGPRQYDGQVQRLTDGPVRKDPQPEVLTVVVWNVAWAFGAGSDGTGQAKPRAHFERNLDTMGRVLAAANPDLVLLQEVDFDSTRSFRMNQAERLARQCGLPFIAPSVSWSANWVPFPYWPPAEHFGHMMSGGAVLSRYPLQNNRVELLPKPTSNPWWYNLFYLFRFIQRVDVEAPDGSFTAVNTHLEAFDLANRMNQAYRLRAVLDDLESKRVVLGGDLNSVPPESPQRNGYPDEPETDHRSDETVAVLRTAKGLRDAVAVKTFTSTPSAWFTFPAEAPNRRLDYVFVSEAYEVVSTRVLSEAGTPSDHLPVIAELRLKK